jgi:prepilin-type N-terminal cleavage/methylation domain-containing protein
MSASSERGMTVVEILVAIVILAIGLLVLAGGSVVVTRNLTRGRLAMLATARAEAKLDELRAIGASTVPNCGSVNFASSVSAQTFGKITLSWTITPTTGAEREVQVRTQYLLPSGRGLKIDTLKAEIGC